jgi:hypothetical protein
MGESVAWLMDVRVSNICRETTSNGFEWRYRVFLGFRGFSV